MRKTPDKSRGGSDKYRLATAMAAAISLSTGACSDDSKHVVENIGQTRQALNQWNAPSAPSFADPTANESRPFVIQNGAAKKVLFQSTRSGSQGIDLWVTDAPDGVTFGAPQKISGANTAGNEYAPVFCPAAECGVDSLFYSSTQFNGTDANIGKCDFNTTTNVATNCAELGGTVSEDFEDEFPSAVNGGFLYYATTAGGGSDFEIYRASIGVWTGLPVSGLNTAVNDSAVIFANDGKILVTTNGQVGNLGQSDIYQFDDITGTNPININNLPGSSVINTSLSEGVGSMDTDGDLWGSRTLAGKVQIFQSEFNGAACVNGATQPCGTDVGECQSGLQTCVGGLWDLTCVGEVGPTAETCDGLDNNCDGTPDNGISCSCTNGQTQSCGIDTGACQSGTQTCVTGSWDSCVGSIGPAGETCNGVDDDCDGTIDNGFPDLGTNCTAGEGVCQTSGHKVCKVDGTGTVCDAVPNAGAATAEVCGDGLDNNCDGQVDEGCGGTGGAGGAGSSGSGGMGGAGTGGMETGGNSGSGGMETTGGTGGQGGGPTMPDCAVTVQTIKGTCEITSCVNDGKVEMKLTNAECKFFVQPEGVSTATTISLTGTCTPFITGSEFHPNDCTAWYVDHPQDTDAPTTNVFYTLANGSELKFGLLGTKVGGAADLDPKEPKVTVRVDQDAILASVGNTPIQGFDFDDNGTDDNGIIPETESATFSLKNAAILGEPVDVPPGQTETPSDDGGGCNLSASPSESKDPAGVIFMVGALAAAALRRREAEKK